VLEYALHPSRVPVAPADCVGPDGTFGSSCVGRHGASLDRYLSFTRYYSEPERPRFSCQESLTQNTTRSRCIVRTC
jgi:hypothetical protein